MRDALLWNDTRSAGAAADLVDELGGPQAWVDAVDLVPVASFTVTKLRWLAEHQPDNAVRVASVVLPHDWLTGRILQESGGFAGWTTDRGDASGTGYWSAATEGYRDDLVRLALEAEPGAGGLTLLPYLDGERTPDLPDATGTLTGLTRANATCPCRGGGHAAQSRRRVDALRERGIRVERVLLIGGASASAAVRALAADLFGVPVVVPAAREYVALGAARQATWSLSGELPRR